MNLPEFPEFRRITLDDQEWYNHLYAHFEPYADFSFGNLMIWLDQRNDLAAAELNGNLVLRCTNLYMNDQVMFNVLGKRMIDETIDAIFAYQASIGMKQELLGVANFVADQISNKESLEIVEDRDNAEYILDTHLLGALDGPTMKRLRQDINGYERRAEGEVVVKELDLEDSANVEFLRTNLESWEKAFSTNESATQEKQVIERTMSLVGKLPYRNLSVYVGDKLAGFAMYQLLPHGNIVVVNHLKTSYEFRHTSFFLSHKLAASLWNKNIAYMNYEQDLGLPGLRDFKEKLKPDHLLPKYNITKA